MSVWRQVARGLRVLFDRQRADADIADEVLDYYEHAVAGHLARGLTPAQARRAATLELGGAVQVAEQVRGYGWENVVDTTLADIRYAARRLRAAPGFAAVTILTLSLGIGGTTAIFSAVNAILFESLPYPDAGRIVTINELRSDGSRVEGTFGMYHFLAQRSRAFEAMAVLRPWQPALTGGEQPERLDGQRVSADYFRVLGVRPVLGRSFTAADDVAAGPSVVIISDELWQRRFSRDPLIVGRQLRLNDVAHTVIGVMPPAFANVLAPEAGVWAPLQYGLEEGRAWGHHLRTIGRRREGVTAEAAARELNALGAAILAEQGPDTYDPDDVVWSAPSLQSELTRGVRPALLAVLGAVALVLVMACVNVTNLVLARGVHRRGEFALRAALGAGRRRMIRQLLTESMLLAFIAGALGMFVAMAGVKLLVLIAPSDLPRVTEIAVEPTAFVFGFGITTLLGVLVGLMPALQVASGREHRDVQQLSRRTAGEKHRRTRGVLVGAEVALALVLLVASGLLLRSLQRLFAEPPGFQATGVLTMQVQTAGRRLDTDSATWRFFAQVLETVRAVPGVEMAALTSQLPLSGDLDVYGVHFEDSPTQNDEDDRSALRYAVSPGYIEALGIAVKSGRSFTESDRAGAPLVALISESLARRAFPGIDPAGRRLRIGAFDGPAITVVGVVDDVKHQSLALMQPAAVYVPSSQTPFADPVMTLVIRGRGDVRDLADEVRRAVWSVDRNQPVVRIATMAELLRASAAERRFALVLFELFAVAALVLAAAGIYGVLSGSVAERTREIGVRSALGATRRNIAAMVLGEGLKFTVAGVAVGLVGAAAASRLIAALLFGVTSFDPLTWASVVALITTVSLVACALPALRAAGVDPARTLRTD